MVNRVRLAKQPGLYGMGVGLLGIGHLARRAWAVGSWLASGWPGLHKVREASCLGDERDERDERDEARRLRADWQTRRLVESQAELKHNSLCVGPPDLTYQHSK
jgi:hypothetical protein